jgi:hypothetical protein
VTFAAEFASKSPPHTAHQHIIQNLAMLLCDENGLHHFTNIKEYCLNLKSEYLSFSFFLLGEFTLPKQILIGNQNIGLLLLNQPTK